jgi:hypothetical protein
MDLRRQIRRNVLYYVACAAVIAWAVWAVWASGW